jgi:uncharacterized protein (DUF1697 family)
MPATMARWVAFLRGMNLGRRRITNEELCEAFAELGLEEAAAFLASGNVVFDAPERAAAKLAARIESGLATALHYPVPTFLRSAEEVREIAAQTPFPAPVIERSRGKLQAALFEKPASPAAIRAVLALANDEDRLVIVGRTLFWLPSGGILESELDLKTIGEHLGQMTMRTRRTFERIASRFLA